MTSTNFTTTHNNSERFYIPNTPDYELPALNHTSSVFPNIVFDDETESNVQPASKKIRKPGPNETKKVTRKKHNKTRNPWTQSEDRKLLQLLKKHGLNWALISAGMEGRSGKQVRDRYLNKLNPEIKKCGDWTPAEDEIMAKLIKEVGNRWSLISSHLPGRTEGQVKNRYYSSMKKKMESSPQSNQNPAAANTGSESVSNLPTSPQHEEEPKFDFRIEYDTNMISFNRGDSITLAQTTEYMISSEAYPNMYTHEISAQNHIVHTEISSGVSNSFLTHNVPMAGNCQSEILEKVINHFDNIQPPVASSAHSNFSGNRKSQNTNSGSENRAVPEEKMTLLARRKAYLELALAKTIKEMKTF